MKVFLATILLVPVLALAAFMATVTTGPYTLTNLATGTTSSQPDLTTCAAAAASQATAAGPGAICTSVSVITFTPVPTNPGLPVDSSKIPPPTPLGTTDPYGNVLVKNYPAISTQGAETVTPSDEGAFRVGCVMSHMLFDDPILHPGQPGASHLHLFFGNGSASAATTAANIMQGASSSCAGGTLYLSADWVPAMLDGQTPLTPAGINVYYKTGYQLAASSIQPIPANLRMVAGDMNNATAPAQATTYICYGPNGENPGWSGDIASAYKLGTCVAGATFTMQVQFPQCWDGVNLDSPDHQSHMSQTEQYSDGQGGFPWRCPASHPVPIPGVSYQVNYAVTDRTQVSRWRLASDTYDASLPGGLSGHGDYWNGWDPATEAVWMKDCLQASVDGHENNTCDGRRLQ